MSFIIRQWKNTVGIEMPLKDQTRRLVKPGELLRVGPEGPEAITQGGREKWRVGKTYALVPKMGKPAIWEHPSRGYMDDVIHYRPDYWAEDPHEHIIKVDSREFYRDNGWTEVRLLITGLRSEHLWAISDRDVRREGVNDRDAYCRLWIELFGRKSWEQNPLVWVIDFKYNFGARQ